MLIFPISNFFSSHSAEIQSWRTVRFQTLLFDINTSVKLTLELLRLYLKLYIRRAWRSLTHARQTWWWQAGRWRPHQRRDLWSCHHGGSCWWGNPVRTSPPSSYLLTVALGWLWLPSPALPVHPTASVGLYRWEWSKTSVMTLSLTDSSRWLCSPLPQFGSLLLDGYQLSVPASAMFHWMDRCYMLLSRVSGSHLCERTKEMFTASLMSAA